MEHRARVEKAGPNCYLLPKAGDMETEVRAFLSAPLFEETDEALRPGLPDSG